LCCLQRLYSRNVVVLIQLIHTKEFQTFLKFK
jgi:hypothetical protein